MTAPGLPLGHKATDSEQTQLQNLRLSSHSACQGGGTCPGPKHARGAPKTSGELQSWTAPSLLPHLCDSRGSAGLHSHPKACPVPSPGSLSLPPSQESRQLTAGPVDLDGLGADEGVGAVLAHAVLPAERHLVADGERLPAARDTWGWVRFSSCMQGSCPGAPGKGFSRGTPTLGDKSSHLQVLQTKHLGW